MPYAKPRIRLFAAAAGGSLLALARMAPAVGPTDFFAVSADPTRLSNKGADMVLIDGSQRFEGGGVTFLTPSVR